jgi:hypothetical protein
VTLFRIETKPCYGALSVDLKTNPIPIALPPATRTAHPDEETLELYALNRLEESLVERVEEHLLTCTHCQDSLAETDEYVTAVRSVLAEPAPAPSPEAGSSLLETANPMWAAMKALWKPVRLSLQGMPRLAPALSVGMAVLLLGFLVRDSQGWGPGSAAATLYSMRGSQTPLAKAPADHTLNLTIHSDSVAVDRNHSIRIVDEVGNQVWNGSPSISTVRSSEGFLIHVEGGLRSGSYWVRLHDPQGVLLQEYGLGIE